MDAKPFLFTFLCGFSMWAVAPMGIAQSEPQGERDDAIENTVKGLLKGLSKVSSDKVEIPQTSEPSNGALITGSRTITLRWNGQGEQYDLEIDCMGCNGAGWNSGQGAAWRSVESIKNTEFNFVFSSGQEGRWRVRSTNSDKKSEWTPWSYFVMDTTDGATDQGDFGEQQQGPPEEQLGQLMETETSDGEQPVGEQDQVYIEGQGEGQDQQISEQAEEPSEPQVGEQESTQIYPEEPAPSEQLAEEDKTTSLSTKGERKRDGRERRGPEENVKGATPGMIKGIKTTPPTPEEKVVTGVTPNTTKFTRTGKTVEKCYGINSSGTGFVKVGDKWLYKKGQLVLLEFEKANEMKRVRRVIKHYSADRICMLKTKGQRYVYFLKRGAPIQGSLPNERCIAINPATVKVRYASQGGWRVEHGNTKLRRVAIYGSDAQGAKRAAEIIKQRQLTRLCFSAKKKPRVAYLRR